MGEIIKKLTDIRLGGENFSVELNHAASQGGQREIHIQNDSFRLAVPEKEFLQICASVLLARKQLEQIKGTEKLKNMRGE